MSDAPAIDARAPVQCSPWIMIDAASSAVWAVLRDVARWADWMPRIRAARLDGRLAPGGVIHWRIDDMRIVSRLTHVDAPTRLAWAGGDGESEGVHVWSLLAVGRRTRLVNAESFDGPAARADPAAFRERLVDALEQWNLCLKRRVEGGAR